MQRLHGDAGVGGDQEFGLLVAMADGAGLDKLHLEAPAGHRQVLHRARDLGRHLACRRGTRLRQRLRGRVVALARRGFARAQRVEIAGGRQRRELVARFRQQLGQGFRCARESGARPLCSAETRASTSASREASRSDRST